MGARGTLGSLSLLGGTIPTQPRFIAQLWFIWVVVIDYIQWFWKTKKRKSRVRTEV